MPTRPFRTLVRFGLFYFSRDRVKHSNVILTLQSWSDLWKLLLRHAYPAMIDRAGIVLIWLAASGLAIFFALQFHPAAFSDGQYLPVGNDSFYHARRILDAAIGERGFYQFDSMIHVPEGSWITWPWAYDWLVAQALAATLMLLPQMQPMAFLANVAVVWIFVNMGILAGIIGSLKLQLKWRAVVLLAFALSPLTQILHGQGVIDHHFVELTFVLLTVWRGLLFFADTTDRFSALTYGAALGIAPAFHTSLFILQVPLLVASFILWIRSDLNRTSAISTLTSAFLGATLLVVTASEPFRDFQFQFGTLSWFHLYIAACTAFATNLMYRLRCTVASVATFVVACLVLLVPLVPSLSAGTEYLGAEAIRLSTIAEVKSPLEMLLDPGGWGRVLALYGLPIVAAIPLLIAFFWRSLTNISAPQVYFSVWCVFGLTMLMTQFRLHPFGSFVLVLGPIILLERYLDRLPVKRGLSTLIWVTATVVLYQPSIANQLFIKHPAGLDAHYSASRKLYNSLADACSEDSGLVLAYHDDGHYVRFHSDCSVLANNFLLTQQHEQKYSELEILLAMSPTDLIDRAPQVKYVFVRLENFYISTVDGVRSSTDEELRAFNDELFLRLVFDTDIPQQYQLLDELLLDDDRSFAYARLFKISNLDQAP